MVEEKRPPLRQGSVPALLGRVDAAVLDRQRQLCEQDPIVQTALAAVDGIAVVVNAWRQVVAANSRLLQSLEEGRAGAFVGLRPGEILDCIHSNEVPEGCGHAPACRHCGALISMLASLERGESAQAECLLSTRRAGRWEGREYAVHTMPLRVEDQDFALVAFRDISSEKRRAVLEFSYLQGFLGSLRDLRDRTDLMRAAGADPADTAGVALAEVQRITLEAESKAQLLKAERGELTPTFRSVSPDHILDRLWTSLSFETVQQLFRRPTSPGFVLFRTDPDILCQVLRKMVFNAVEALPAGGIATVWHEERHGRPTFVVQNSGCLPADVAERIFQRSFSTKAGSGRGLGTYGMKLLGESVLGGVVAFTTSREEGTRFSIELPGDD